MKADFTVILKNEDTVMRKNYQKYSNTDGDVVFSRDCPVIQSMVDEALLGFKGDPDHIIIKAELIWQ